MIIFTGDIAKGSKRDYMVNVQFSAKFFFAYAAVLALVTIAFSGIAALALPIWAIIVNGSALPGCTVFAGHIFRAPLAIASVIAKELIVPLNFAIGTLKFFAADSTINRIKTAFVARITASLESIPLPQPLTLKVAKVIFVHNKLAHRLRYRITAITTRNRNTVIDWAILTGLWIIALPGIMASFAAKSTITLFHMALSSFENLSAISAGQFYSTTSIKPWFSFAKGITAFFGAAQIFFFQAISPCQKFFTAVGASCNNHQKHPFGSGRIRQFGLWGADCRSARRSTGDQPVIAPRFNFSTGVL